MHRQEPGGPSGPSAALARAATALRRGDVPAAAAAVPAVLGAAGGTAATHAHASRRRHGRRDGAAAPPATSSSEEPREEEAQPVDLAAHRAHRDARARAHRNDLAPRLNQRRRRPDPTASRRRRLRARRTPTPTPTAVDDAHDGPGRPACDIAPNVRDGARSRHRGRGLRGRRRRTQRRPGQHGLPGQPDRPHAAAQHDHADLSDAIRSATRAPRAPDDGGNCRSPGRDPASRGTATAAPRAPVRSAPTIHGHRWILAVAARRSVPTTNATVQAHGNAGDTINVTYTVTCSGGSTGQRDSGPSGEATSTIRHRAPPRRRRHRAVVHRRGAGSRARSSARP